MHQGQQLGGRLELPSPALGYPDQLHALQDYHVANYYHASDDLYWWKYTRKFYIRDHRNPATADGVWYGPGGSIGFVASSNFNCDGGFPPIEVCRFN